MTPRDRTSGSNVESSSAATSEPRIPNPAVFDLVKALERVEGDRSLLIEMCQVLKEDCGKTVQAMRHAIAETNFTHLEHLAHSLKGSSASLSALELSDAAARLEKLARDTDFSGSWRCVAEIEQKAERLISEFETLS